MTLNTIAYDFTRYIQTGEEADEYVELVLETGNTDLIRDTLTSLTKTTGRVLTA